MYTFSYEYGLRFQNFSCTTSFLWLLISLALMAILIAAKWKIFTKAGVPGWASLIPLYSTYKLFEIAWGKGIVFLLLLLPGVNVVIAIILWSKLAKSFGEGTVFSLGLIFLPAVFLLIMAFGDSEYIGPDGT